jgi:hypothetical protein
MRVLVLAPLLVGLLVLGTAACGFGDDSEQDDGIPVELSPEDRAYDEENLALLEEFPSFAGAELLRTDARRAVYPDGRYAAAIYVAPQATADEVLQFYKEQLPDMGWELADEQEGTADAYEKGPARLWVNVDSLEDTDQLLLIVDSRYAAAATPTADGS